ncbi:hypothetical protein D1872_321700 [compost metagenome]
MPKLARDRGCTAASVPPAIITSASPLRIRRNASPIAVLPIEQAVTGDKVGPIAPYRMLICAAAILEIIIGTRLGLTRPGPRC